MLSGAFHRELALSRIAKREWRLDRGLVPLLRTLAKGSMIYDFGAGVGLYCAALDCRGVDGIPGIGSLSPGRVMEGNLSDPDLQIPRHDMALCLEVAEHIPQEFENTFLGHITRHCTTLVLSWAPPEQPGEGHCNGREFGEVRQKLAARGFVWDEAATQQFRRAATLSWLRRNVAVYHRNVGS